MMDENDFSDDAKLQAVISAGLMAKKALDSLMPALAQQTAALMMKGVKAVETGEMTQEMAFLLWSQLHAISAIPDDLEKDVKHGKQAGEKFGRLLERRDEASNMDSGPEYRYT